jgi:CheY-like chemotaxis protein
MLDYPLLASGWITQLEGTSQLWNEAMVVVLAPKVDAELKSLLPAFGFIPKPVRPSRLLEDLSKLRIAHQSRPAPAIPAQPSGEALEERDSARGSKRPRRARILVVEDDSIDQKVAVLLLEKLGYRADCVANGKEAVKLLEMLQYDLVFMDCAMPEMDGLEATRALRRSRSARLQQIAIIAMTANVSRANRDQCMAAGMNDCLAKPIQTEALKEVLKRFLPQARVGGGAR